ncbi:MAG: hypothetical protein LUF83_03270, partial [Alistipes sp.]|nr:hypothetical protein [Alistipes sp.]
EFDFDTAFVVGGRWYGDFGHGENGVGHRGYLRISPPPSVSEAWTVPLNEILPLPCAHTEVAPQSSSILVNTLNLAKKTFISRMFWVNKMNQPAANPAINRDVRS